MRNVLVLCQNNTHRSPLCAQVLRETEPTLTVRSAGFREVEELMAPNAFVRNQAVMLGVDIAGQGYAKRVTKDDLEWAGVIVYMDKSNRLVLSSLLHEWKISKGKKVVPLGNYARPVVQDIPDLAAIRPMSDKFRESIELIIDASKHLAHSLERATIA